MLFMCQIIIILFTLHANGVHTNYYKGIYITKKEKTMPESPKNGLWNKIMFVRYSPLFEKAGV